MRIKIIHADHVANRTPIGQIATAELHFDTGELTGLKLIGFAIWDHRGTADKLSVTFPSRMYSVNGEHRSFALLRPTNNTTDSDSLRDLIIAAYHEQKEA